MRYLLRIIPAVILLQTLFFKFTGAPESIYIFSTLGVEPWGRYFAGASELVAAILLLTPATTFYGSLLTLMIMLGAIASHLFFLGIAVQNDGGLLFMLACVTFLCASLNIYCLKK
ncbi:DoxX family protein [bacterium]|nr:DoxX family protein [bacterium]